MELSSPGALASAAVEGGPYPIAVGGAQGGSFNASNYAHVSAGRAHVSGSYALANGSNQNMGLYNTFYTSKLRQTGTNYYVIDNTCP